MHQKVILVKTMGPDSVTVHFHFLTCSFKALCGGLNGSSWWQKYPHLRILLNVGLLHVSLASVWDLVCKAWHPQVLCWRVPCHLLRMVCLVHGHSYQLSFPCALKDESMLALGNTDRWGVVVLFASKPHCICGMGGPTAH